jgi:hypothetical protein
VSFEDILKKKNGVEKCKSCKWTASGTAAPNTTSNCYQPVLGDAESPPVDPKAHLRRLPRPGRSKVFGNAALGSIGHTLRAVRLLQVESSGVWFVHNAEPSRQTQSRLCKATPAAMQFPRN